MPTCRDIVTLALRQARIVGIGRTATAAEAQEGFTALTSLYDSMFADGPLGPFTDVYKTDAYAAKENERVFAPTATITIPATITEGSEVRRPRDLSAIIVVSDTATQKHVYSMGAWEVAHGLTLDSEAPLASRDQVGLAALLAMQYAEMFGAELLPATARRAMRFKAALSHKFSTKREAVEYF